MVGMEREKRIGRKKLNAARDFAGGKKKGRFKKKKKKEK